MIVQCPECQSQYRVKDGKVPDSGGKITCPSCSHEFVVYPEKSQGSGPKRARTREQQRRAREAAQSGSGTRKDGSEAASEQQQGVVAGSDDSAPGAAAEEAAATDVMSRDELPGFMQEGGDDDGTSFGGGDEEVEGAPADEVEAAATDIVNSGVLDQAFGGTDDQASGDEPSPDSHHEVRGAEPASDRSSDALPASNTPESGGPSLDTYAPSDDDLDGADASGSLDAGGGEPEGADREVPVSEQRGGEPRQQGRAASEPDRGGDSSMQGEASGGAPSDGPGPDYDGPWKLQTDAGLTYEFPDTDALLDWMADRSDRDEFRVSPDGSTFYDLGELPQFSPEAMEQADRGPAPSGRHDAVDGGGRSPSGRHDAVDDGASPSGRHDAVDGGASPSGRHDAVDGGASPSGTHSSVDGPSPSDPEPWETDGSEGLADEDPADFAESLASGSDPSQGSAASTDGDGAKRTQAPVDASTGSYELPQKEPETLDNRLLYGAFFLLMLIATGVGLQIFGIYDLSGVIPGFGVSQASQSGATAGGPSAPAANTPNVPIDEGESGLSKSERTQVNRVLEAARQSMKNNRLKTAIEKLNAAKLLAPKRPEIYEMLADVYEKMGKPEKSETHRKRATELRKRKADGADQGAPQKGTGSSPDNEGARPPGDPASSDASAGPPDAGSSSNSERDRSGDGP